MSSPCSHYYGESGDFYLTKLIIMADISKCQGTNCPIRTECYRYTAPSNDYQQAYLMESPYNVEDRKCTHFWDNADRK